MIIFNTTYHVPNERQKDFFEWLKKEHIPMVFQTSSFSNPCFYEVLTTDDCEGKSFSLQFEVKSEADYLSWEERYSHAFQRDLKRFFGSEVLSFSTLLKPVE